MSNEPRIATHILEDPAIPVEGDPFFLSTLQADPERSPGQLEARALGRLAVEHSRATAALRESEARFRSAFEHAAIGMALVALDGRWLQVNRSICHITGYTPEELQATDFQALTHPDDLDADLRLVQDLIAGRIREYQMSKRYFHNLGHVVWVLLSVSLVRDDLGRPLYFISQIQDINERKRAEEALRASERQFRTLASHAPVGIFQRDADGKNVFVNERWCSMTGMSAEEAAGAGWFNAIHPEDRDRVAAEWQQVIPNGEEFLSEYRYLSQHGKVTWVQGNASPLRDETGAIIGYLGTSTDVTERKRGEWLEQDRREVLELVAQDQPLGSILDRLTHLVERQTDAGAAVVLFDESHVTLHARNLPLQIIAGLRDPALGLAGSCVDGVDAASHVFRTTDLTQCPAWEGLRPALLSHGLEAAWSISILSNEGLRLGVVAVFCPLLRIPGEVEKQMLEMVGKLATISIEHHQTTRQLAHLVRHDALTGLPNRVLFEDRFQQALPKAAQNGSILALLAIDLDRFKSINDTLGHRAGDEVLQQFARRIKLLVRGTDTLARVGGDEFLLLLPELTSPDGATRVAKIIVGALTEPFTAGNQTIQVTASIGIALAPVDGADGPTLQASADAAMYRAKRQGRNCYIGGEARKSA